MLYTKTEYNILHLLNITGTLKREQLTRFFSDHTAENYYTIERVEYILKKLCDNSYLRYDFDADTYSSVNAPQISNEIMQRRIKAFWVIANTSSRDILQILKLEYPAQFMFITADNEVFDITVVYSLSDAANASSMWAKHTCGEDQVFHIAVVNDRDLGLALDRYGFDCYCMIDPKTYNASYADYS